jgi:hypothetical protein
MILERLFAENSGDNSLVKAMGKISGHIHEQFKRSCKAHYFHSLENNKEL